jgi:vitamin B12 transporter
VLGGTQAPQLTGKRPQNTPRWTVTAGAVLNPDPLLTLEGYVRFESRRWSDDLNTLLVGQYTTMDVRATFHVIRGADVYFAVDNAFNALIPVARAADQTISIDEPRLFRAGIRLAY